MQDFSPVLDGKKRKMLGNVMVTPLPGFVDPWMDFQNCLIFFGGGSGKGFWRAGKKAYSTQCSQVVAHLSTNWA